MAITKKALRKQAAKARMAARRSASNATPSESSSIAASPAEPASLVNTLPAVEDEETAPGRDSSTVPTNTTETIAPAQGPVPPIASETQENVTAPSSSISPANIDVEILAPLSKQATATQTSPAPKRAPIPAVAPSGTSATPPLPPSSTCTTPHTNSRPPQRHARLPTSSPESSGPSNLPRDPATGMLVDEPEEDPIVLSSTFIISDEMLAMKLQLEEIRKHTDRKGKFRSDRVPDLQLALTAFQAEVDRHIEFLNDVRFANSLANAVHDDARIIAELGQEEIRAEEDRRMALELGGVYVEPLERPTPSKTIATVRPGITG